MFNFTGKLRNTGVDLFVNLLLLLWLLKPCLRNYN